MSVTVLHVSSVAFLNLARVIHEIIVSIWAFACLFEILSSITRVSELSMRRFVRSSLAFENAGLFDMQGSIFAESHPQ